MAKKIIEIQAPYNFIPRDYQVPILAAFDNGVRFIDIVMHRRAGKDKTCIALLAKAMLERVGGYYYVFPEFNQGRKALWDNMDNDGFRTLKHIPEELWSSINSQQMKLELKNGSYLQVVGSNEVDSLVGSNPLGLVFSEWSLQDPIVLGYLRPIINANKGWMIFNYTPRGDNHAKQFHIDAGLDPEWFSVTCNVDDTHMFTPKQLEKERNAYLKMYGDDALFQQEYYCSFETPVSGAYYGTHVRLAKVEGRISKVSYNPDLSVYTAWDLGVSDNTVIIFYQKPDNNRINIIDHYEMYGAGMEHFRDILNSKGYRYATHYLPHDADNQIQGRVVETRADMLRSLMPSDRFVIVDKQQKVGVMDGIQKTRSLFHKFWFDESRCERLIACLKNYHSKQSTKDALKGIMPVHDWSSHSADALRMLSISYEEIQEYKDPNVARSSSFSW